MIQCLQETEKKWNDKMKKENYSTTIGVDVKTLFDVRMLCIQLKNLFSFHPRHSLGVSQRLRLHNLFHASRPSVFGRQDTRRSKICQEKSLNIKLAYTFPIDNEKLTVNVVLGCQSRLTYLFVSEPFNDNTPVDVDI